MLTPPQKPKKVLFLITKSNWGGAQRYVYDLATHLDRSRFESVVALGGSGVLKEQLSHANIRTHQLLALANKPSLRVFWRSCCELYTLLRTEQPTILHVNSSVAGIIGVVTGRLARVPRIIFTAHGWAFNEDRPWWQKIVIKFFHWLTVLLSHKTIAVSNAIISQMNWPLAQRRMKRIYLGRTIGPMYPKTEARIHLTEYATTLATHQKDLWLGCVAELHPIKRLHVLITATAELVRDFPTLRLVLIGDGSLRTTLTAQIVDQRLEQHVFLLGAIPEAARFLKAFDICCLPSKSESYGYVLHEAGLAGVPVVATNVGGIPEVVIHTVTGLLVSPDDVSALAHSLTTLLTNPALRQTYASAHQEAMSKRSVASMVDATSALYELPLS